ncbi:MAG: adenylosuccinate synthase [Desulfovibrio sp.]|jgi:adenylosuccinate synthase|nr:adenylosuccinate synthase [Desulfovibrio sp.]
MPNLVVVGTQWGDEGKGKIVDLLAARVAAVVRFQGGHNAGHTVAVGGEEYKLRLIPSGILHPGTVCMLGNGVVLDLEELSWEIESLAARGVDVGAKRLRISRKCHLILPYHRLLDEARENYKGEGKIGTTGRGIGPCYEDKAGRCGVRVCDLENMELVRRKIRQALDEKNALLAGLYGQKPLTEREVLERIVGPAVRIKPYLADISEEIARVEGAGGDILFEGAQGTHLDIDHGTYPFVTSSSTVAGNAAAGSGVGPEHLHRVLGVVKAYTTRVGSGGMPTEQGGEIGRYLQKKGVEFGTVTGRERRCGWLDMVILRESVRLCGVNSLALTKLDVLSGLPELKICVAYNYRGQVVEYPPQAEGGLAEAVPVYETMSGWTQSLDGIRSFAGLPEAALDYVRRLEELVGRPVSMVSVGPDRDQTIMR